MQSIVIWGQYFAIGILFFCLLYISILRPCDLQLMLLLLNVSTILMFVGYSMELSATNVDAAMYGVGVNYIGKPFALLFATLFIAYYCGVDIPRRITFLHAIIHALFPVIVFSNGSHHLYYATVAFDSSRPFSPLILTHGPLYYLYVAALVIHLIYDYTLIIREYKKSQTWEAKKQAISMFVMISCCVVGYILFLSGITGGYDTTIAGSFVGIMILTVSFFHNRLFDFLTLAKEHALDTVNNGLLVRNARHQVVYSNKTISRLLQNDFSLDELDGLPYGKSTLPRGDKVYEIRKEEVREKDLYFGEVVEVSDVTESAHYSQRLKQDVEERTKEIQHIQRKLVSSFAGLIDARDSDTGMHAQRLSHLVKQISDSLVSNGDYLDELSPDFVVSLSDIAPLHDIGKLSIPDMILLKPGKLTENEFKIMKTHTVQGKAIIDQCMQGVENEDYIRLAEDVTLYHHERWDGTGYPTGLSGTDIPLSARITAIADVYDALRSDRCYKKAYSAEKARQIISDGRGSQFDPLIVDAFLRCLSAAEQEQKSSADYSQS